MALRSLSRSRTLRPLPCLFIFNGSIGTKIQSQLCVQINSQGFASSLRRPMAAAFCLLFETIFAMQAPQTDVDFTGTVVCIT